MRVSGPPLECFNVRVYAAADAVAVRLERRLYDAVGPGREKEAAEVIEMGRLTWRLRDDDNILVGRLESQLLRALREGAARLRHNGRLGTKPSPRPEDAKPIAEALRQPESGPVLFDGPGTRQGITFKSDRPWPVTH